MCLPQNSWIYRSLYIRCSITKGNNSCTVGTLTMVELLKMLIEVNCWSVKPYQLQRVPHRWPIDGIFYGIYIFGFLLKKAFSSYKQTKSSTITPNCKLFILLF
ncbi:hypothetical protein ABKN59_001381 [Abortiporus biennis]